MARVIQDSDEDEEIAISPIRKSNSNRVASVDSGVELEQHGVNGGQTRSTEHSKLDNTQAQPVYEQLCSTKRPRGEGREPYDDDPLAEMAPKKRTKTMHTTSQSPASCSAKQKSGRRKTMKTYGTPSKSGFFDSIEEDYANFDNYRADKDDPNQQAAASQATSITSTEVKADRNCQGQVNQLPQRELSAGFPPPSSTVPNHTATQERIAEAMRDNAYDAEFHAERIRGEAGIDTLRDPASFTITDPPCSESNFPLHPNHDRSSPSPYYVPEQTPSSIPSHRSRAKTTRDISVFGLETSTRSLNSSQGQKTRSKTVHDSGSGHVDDDIDLVSISTERKTVTSKAHMMDQSYTSPLKSKTRPRRHSKLAEHAVGKDEQFNSDDLAIGLPKERYVPRPSRSRSTRCANEEAADAQSSHAGSEKQSDDVEVGLPKERYKPRPSRSRSQRVSEQQPVTMQPQANSNGRRRSKRQPSDERPVEPSMPHSAKVRKIEDMGFRGSQAKRALENSDGHLEDAVDILLCGDQLKQEEQQDRPSNDAASNQDDEQSVFIHEDDADIIFDAHGSDDNQGQSDELGHGHGETTNLEQCESKNLRHVEILPPEKKPLASSKKGAKRKRAKTTPHPSRQQHFVIDDSDEDECQQPVSKVNGNEFASSIPYNESAKIEVKGEHDQDEAPSSKLAKNRGRRRTKSIKKQQEEKQAAGNADLADTEMPEEANAEPNRDSPLKEVAGNALQSTSPEEAKNDECGKSDEKHHYQREDIPEKDDRTPSPSKPEVSKREGSSSAQHSPLKKSSKIFRVGLSRKVRIAPLLRIVKK